MYDKSITFAEWKTLELERMDLFEKWWARQREEAIAEGREVEWPETMEASDWDEALSWFDPEEDQC